MLTRRLLVSSTKVSCVSCHWEDSKSWLCVEQCLTFTGSSSSLCGRIGAFIKLWTRTLPVFAELIEHTRRECIGGLKFVFDKLNLNSRLRSESGYVERRDRIHHPD